MNTQHTQGPWSAHHDHGWLVVESANGDLYLKIEKGSSAQKCMADARLISAAPDLLQALEEVLAYCVEHGHDWMCMAQAKAAVIKAVGESK